MKDLTKLNRRRWAVQLALTTGLALLFLMALLWGLRGVTPASADPGDLYVDGASGQDMPTCGTTITPCQTISYTLNSRASDGDTILIATGTYTENLTITGITLTLRGGYAISGTLWLTGTSETVINGNSANGVFLLQDSNTVLDNLTITGGSRDSGAGGGGVQIWGGSAIIANSVITDNVSSADGGGLAAYGPLTLELQNVVIANNQAGQAGVGNGGGLYLRNAGLQATLTGVQVYGNSAAEGGGGTGVDDPGASVVISDSQIYSNTALGPGGGGIRVSEASLSMSNSSVMDNSAPNGQSGGIDVGSGGTVNVVDSIIADNSTRDHGGAATADPGATLNLTNVLITGNSATSGNANVLAMWDGQVTVINSTISDNNPQGAQAVILWSGALTITNSIMWNNALNLQGDPPCPECFTVTYSDIEGGWTGTGNINADPLFVGGDYHLGVGSPCIDKGTSVGAPVTDIEGTPRDAAPDMGAYEWTGFRIFLPLTLRNFGP